MRRPTIGRALNPAEIDEFWRRTQDALRDHPESGEPDPAWERATTDCLANEDAPDL